MLHARGQRALGRGVEFMRAGGCGQRGDVLRGDAGAGHHRETSRGLHHELADQRRTIWRAGLRA